MVIKDNDGDKTQVNDDGSLSSHFYNSAQEMKDELNLVAPSLCLAKWKQVSLHLPTGLTNSCYHPPLHKINITDIKEDPSCLHNTLQKESVRSAMLSGHKQDSEALSECSYCWKMEANGQLSDRHYRSAEPWAAEHLKAIVNNDEGCRTPSYVEVNFNNACNLSCSYCSPQFSSSWMADVREAGPYPTTVPHNDANYFKGERKVIPHSQPNPYVDAFWKWWPELYPQLKHFRMTGGEPLMDKNTYKVFDYVLDNPKPDLHLNVTSNFSVEDKLFDKYIDYCQRLCAGDNIEHLMTYVSVDTFGPQAEYIRNGLDFNRLLDNVSRYLEEVSAKNSITFIITMNNLSVTNLGKLLSYILALRQQYSHTYQRVWFDTPVLRYPQWQSLQTLTAPQLYPLYQSRKYMQENLETEATQFKGFKDYEIQRMERDIAWAKEELDPTVLQQAMKDFYLFFSEHDRRRGTTFLYTFPELTDFWLKCKSEAYLILR